MQVSLIREIQTQEEWEKKKKTRRNCKDLAISPPSNAINVKKMKEKDQVLHYSTLPAKGFSLHVIEGILHPIELRQ